MTNVRIIVLFLFGFWVQHACAFVSQRQHHYHYHHHHHPSLWRTSSSSSVYPNNNNDNNNNNNNTKQRRIIQSSLSRDDPSIPLEPPRNGAFQSPLSKSKSKSNVNANVKTISLKDSDDNKDSKEKFSCDLTKVLKELRETDDDPEVPAFLKQRRLSMTNAWKLDDWVKHSTRFRFIHYARSFPSSRLLRRVAPQFSAFVVWTTLVVVLSPRGMLQQAVVPLTPLSLVSTFVGALLTMRSNTGLSRLAEGRVAWGNVIWQTREVAQLIATKIYPKDPQLSFLMARYTSIFAFVMKAHLRGKQKDIADVVRTMLPPVDAEYVLCQRKLPVAVMFKLRQGIEQIASQGKLTTAEEMSLDRSIERLDEAVMITDRISASPIPPLYTSHTSRLLMFYLAFLPLALHQSSLNGFVTFIVSSVVGYTMLGLDEISHLLEQPFRFMPLLQLSKYSMLDVGDSMVCRPPPTDLSLSQLGHDLAQHNEPSEYSITRPEYW